MTPTYAIYCRAAHTNASDPTHSIESQKRTLLSLARHLGLSVKHVFADIGSSKKERPQFRALIDHLERREISAVLTTDLSRLTRDCKEMQTLSEMMEHGTIREIRTLRESLVSPFMLSIHGILLRHEQMELSERIKRGIAFARHQKASC